MKQLLTTIAALVLLGCGESQSPEPPTAKAPDISIHDAADNRNTEAVKKHLATGTDMNANSDNFDSIPLQNAVSGGHAEIADLLRKHGGKTKKEREATGN